MNTPRSHVFTIFFWLSPFLGALIAISQVKVNILIKDAQKWHTSNILRAYIKAIEEMHMTENTPAEIKTELEVWIKWANAKADVLDPLLNQSWQKISI